MLSSRISTNVLRFAAKAGRTNRNSTRSYTDLRSDTLTKPSNEMLKTALNAQLGDDVFGEDPTVNRLQEKTAEMFNKEDALWLPSGTMANLVAVMAHCHERASEVICGRESHITLWEGGNISNIAAVHPRQVDEDDMGKMALDGIRDVFRLDNDGKIF